MATPDKTTDDFAPEVLEAFDRYVHGFIDRREFLRRSSAFAVGAAGAAGLLEALNPRYAEAAEVSPDDSAIEVSHVVLPAPGKWDGYLVKPAAKERTASVLVVHENRGRNPYIEDVARRLGKAGYLALAPDALTPFGGWPGNDDEGRELQRKLDPAEMMENWVAALHFLETHPASTGKVGAVGFCYGGGVVNLLAARVPALAAAVPFYGRPAPLDEVVNIKAPLMIHNAELDTRLMAVAGPYQEALKAKGITFEAFVYKGAYHGFHNNSTPRYNEVAAKLAWQRTLGFLAKHLD